MHWIPQGNRIHFVISVSSVSRNQIQGVSIAVWLSHHVWLGMMAIPKLYHNDLLGVPISILRLCGSIPPPQTLEAELPQL